MNAYRRGGGKIHALLTLTLDGTFTIEERDNGIHWVGGFMDSKPVWMS
jgi:hypothetical protein